MPFRLTARVITQLGAELISSDEVALYELTKNGFDAGSKIVTIAIQYGLSPRVIEDIVALLSRPQSATGSALPGRQIPFVPS